MNRRSDPKEMQTVVDSEKQEGDDESCENRVEAGFMAYGRCCGIVVDGNCSCHNFSTDEQCESRT